MTNSGVSGLIVVTRNVNSYWNLFTSHFVCPLALNLFSWPALVFRAPTRAEVQPQIKEVHFDRESLNDPIDREAADMRSGDRRLSSFERIEPTIARHDISRGELLALAHIGMYLCADHQPSGAEMLVLKLRCSFCRHSYRHAHFGFLYVNLIYSGPDYLTLMKLKIIPSISTRESLSAQLTRNSIEL